MSENLEELKPLVRSIILSLGRRATEAEFRREYYNVEGESFNIVLDKFKMSFYDFMKKLPDCCDIWKSGCDLFIERVSNTKSSHMDNLTIEKKRTRNGRFDSLRRRSDFRNTYHTQMKGRIPLKSRLKSIIQRVDTNQQLIESRQLQSPRTSSRAPLSSLINKTLYKFRPQLASNFRPAVQPVLQSVKKAQKPVLHNGKTLFTIYPQLPLNPKSSQPTPLPTATIDPRLAATKVTYIPTTATASDTTKVPTINTTFSHQQIHNDKSSCTRFPRQIKLPLEPEPKSKSSSDQNHTQVTTKRDLSLPATVGNVQSKLTSIRQKRRHCITIPSPPSLSKRPRTEVESNKNDGNMREMINPFAVHIQFINAVLKNEFHQKPDNPYVVLINETVNNIIKKAAKMKTVNGNNNTFKTKNIPMTIPESFVDIKDKSFQTFFELEIETFNSPSQFVFLFNKTHLHRLMEVVNFHYVNLLDPSDLQVQELTPGMVVAAKLKDFWYRAEIVFINKLDQDVLVLLVDYGIMKLVNVNRLRRLENVFTEHSRKSSRGRLFGIKPAGGATEWSIEAIEACRAKLRSTKQYGTIKAQNNGVYELLLIDNLRKQNSLIDYLIGRGFADVDPDAKPSFNAVLI